MTWMLRLGFEYPLWFYGPDKLLYINKPILVRPANVPAECQAWYFDVENNNHLYMPLVERTNDNYTGSTTSAICGNRA
jgi:hypothetical protein